MGTGADTPRGLIFLRIAGGDGGVREITELDAWSGAGLDVRIERDSLPERVGVLVRDDL